SVSSDATDGFVGKSSASSNRNSSSKVNSVDSVSSNGLSARFNSSSSVNSKSNVSSDNSNGSLIDKSSSDNSKLNSSSSSSVGCSASFCEAVAKLPAVTAAAVPSAINTACCCATP